MVHEEGFSPRPDPREFYAPAWDDDEDGYDPETGDPYDAPDFDGGSGHPAETADDQEPTTDWLVEQWERSMAQYRDWLDRLNRRDARKGGVL
jgi:hypothetical protein